MKNLRVTRTIVSAAIFGLFLLALVGSVVKPKAESSTATMQERELCSSAYDSLIKQAAEPSGVSADFLCRIIKAEGRPTYNAETRPSIYRARGVKNLSDPREVIPVMAKLLSDYLRQFGNETLAAAAFDAGPAAVQKYHGVPPYAETRKFIARVMGGTSPLSEANSVPAREQSSSSSASQEGRWVLESVTVSPEIPTEGWSYDKQSSSARFKLYTGDASNFRWDRPPQEVNSNGFTISITVESPKFESSINATGMGLQGDDIGMEAGPRHQPSSQTKSTTFKPQPNSDSFGVKISLGGSVTFNYKYRRAAGRTPEPKAKPENKPATLATIRDFHGDVSMRSPGGSFVDLTTTGTQLREGDDISTGPDGEATLSFSDGSTVDLMPNTQCNIGSLLRQRGDVRIRVNLKIGKVEAKISKSETETPSFSVKTPNSVAAVRGTIFSVRYEDQTQTTTVAVEEGTVDVTSNNSSRVAVSAGRQVQVTRGELGPVIAVNGETTMGPRYIGCYKDTPDFDLNGWLERSRTNTPQRCIANCRDRGFKYAAVQYGESCLCGNSYGKYGPATNCDYKCTGDPSQICGGYSTNSVYQIR